MTDTVLMILTDVLIIVGLVILTIAVYGVFRMPDLYTQLHAASKTVFLGVMPLLIAVSLSGDGAVICERANRRTVGRLPDRAGRSLVRRRSPSFSDCRPRC